MMMCHGGNGYKLNPSVASKLKNGVGLRPTP